jgi:arylsulfatase A-like enzyme
MTDKQMKNIIIIVIDAFRPKNLSLFGYNKETDKNLKKIAQEGIVFRNFFSSSNTTAPSLMSIFTGRFPNNHGIIHQFPYTAEEEFEKMYRERKFWLPSFLGSKGYQTMAIDWIDTFFGEGFSYYKEREEWQGKAKVSSEFPPAEDTMNLAVSKVEKVKEPFFLFIHFWDTHFPFPTIEYKGEQKKDINEVLEEIEDNFQKEYFKKRIIAAEMNLYSVRDMAERYDAAIEEIDRQIGKLYQYLKKQGLWEQTILLILGDHGTNLTEHGIYFSSSSLFDETIHAPFIAHFPGFGRKEIDGFVQNTDIAPTVLELIGERENGKDWQFDGKSMVDLIKNNKEIRDKVFFFDGLCKDVKGVRTKDKKLITARNPECHLCKSSHHQEQEEYDLRKDPQEKNNIFKSR